MYGTSLVTLSVNKQGNVVIFLQYIKHERTCLTTFRNTDKTVEDRHVAEYFCRTSRCFVVWINTGLSV